MALLNIHPGAPARIAKLDDSVSDLRYLGLLPGSVVIVLTRSRVGLTLRLAGVTYALGRSAAGAVHVE